MSKELNLHGPESNDRVLELNLNICVIIIDLQFSTSTANTVAPTATPKVVKFVRAIVLDSN
jgi:hypothetical protein